MHLSELSDVAKISQNIVQQMWRFYLQLYALSIEIYS